MMFLPPIQNIFTEERPNANFGSSTGRSAMRGPGAGVRSRPRRSVNDAIILKILVLAILFLAGSPLFSPEFASLITKMVGGLLVGALLFHLAKRGGMPAEVKLYFAFLLWASVSALVVATDVDFSIRSAWTVFQMGLVLWAISVAHQKHQDLGIVMLGVWAFGIFSIVLAFFDPNSVAAIEGSGERMEVMGTNPNGSGQVMVYAMFAALYLGQRTKSWRNRMLLLGSIPVFAFFLLYTGSRKMLVAAVILTAFWLLTSERIGAARGRHLLVHVSVVLAIAGTAMMSISQWEDSIMSRRWDALRTPSIGRTSFDRRQDLYEEGWELFLKNPIAGVGLRNQEIEIGGPVHSEYMDILASTGLVGAALYFSIYIVGFRRAWRVLRVCNGRLRLEWQAFRVYLIMIAWLMVGFPRYLDLLHLIVFGSFIGLFVGFETGASEQRGIRNAQTQRAAPEKGHLKRGIVLP